MLKPADIVSTISTVGTLKAYQEASGRIIIHYLGWGNLSKEWTALY